MTDYHGPCVSCSQDTEWACAHCLANGKTVYVCPACREKHDRWDQTQELASMLYMMPRVWDPPLTPKIKREIAAMREVNVPALTTEDKVALRIPIEALPEFPLERVALYRGGLYAFEQDERSPVRYMTTLDASTRDAVARWCAARIGLEIDWPRFFVEERSDGLLMACLQGRRGQEYWSPVHGSYPAIDEANAVPALASLNARDPRRLPDGARFVDAAALTLVALRLGSQRS